MVGKEHRGDPTRMAILTSLSLLSLILASIPQVLGVDNSTNRLGAAWKPPRSSMFSLFNLKGKSKFWSEKILQTAIEDLERSESSSSKAALENFTKSASIAEYLKLAPVESIYLPIPVNFIFVGFEGKGNQALKLGQEELEKWFQEMDHILEHTRVPQLGEALTPFYRVRADGEQQHHLPLVSFSHYNYSVHAIEMGEKVTQVFERALKVLSRKDDYKDSRPESELLWQVDVESISHIFLSLVHYLQLDNAYNIFILNPKHEPSRGSYGYRRGLSDAELLYIKKEGEVRASLLKSRSTHIANPLEFDRIRRPLYERHPMLKFAWTTVDSAETEHWVETCMNALDSIEKSLQAKSSEEVIVAKAQEILNGKSLDLASALKRELRLEESSKLQQECLVDTWIGNERWAFVDITAGPFTWGPAVGGEGVRTELTLPSVYRSFGNSRINDSESTEEDVQEELQNMIQDRFAVFGDDESTVVDALLAEIDIYELFANKHCEGRNAKLALCDELQQRMKDLSAELEAFQSEDYDEAYRKKAEDALKRIERWNLFSDTHDMKHDYNFSVARDWFLAHLGATLWSSMKHVITPSTADGAFHFYEKIHFQLYVISQERVKHVDLLPLDTSTVREALSTLVLTTQKYQFGVRMLALSDDASLSTAFSVARRAATVPILLVNGTYRTTTRLYLDSLILQHQLQRISKSSSLHGIVSRGRSSLELPIFWFIQDGEPLLIDKHYVAKALPDMVLVVQSKEAAWDSHLQCNGRSISWDLTKPLKHALAAAAEHLTGLLPAHITYSHAHESADQDWTWSSGSHPFASTSSGFKLSDFQSDAIARSYIVTALDESIQLVNDAVEALVKEPAYPHSFGAFRKHEHAVLNSYNNIVNMWKRIGVFMEDLRYVDAVKTLNYLEETSFRFLMAANATVHDLHPINCTRQRKLEMEYGVFGIVGLCVMVIFLWLLLRPKHVKPKIN